MPHGATRVSGGSINAIFAYDPNGNQISGPGRSITFSSWNEPATITQGSRTIGFLDDTSYQRFQQTAPGTSGAQWPETINMRYFHTDNLGSISVITNKNAVV